MSDIQDYIKYNFKKHENFIKTLTTIPPIYVYINRINNGLIVFKIRDEYMLELQTPETMKLFGSTKNRLKKRKRAKS